MALKLMYITNNPTIAAVAQECGVDRIFLDMEYIGKEERQYGMNTVKSHHTVEDVRKIGGLLHDSELLVRVNPIHEKTRDYRSSEEEIEEVLRAGADILMLPMVKTVKEAERFVHTVDGRAKTMLLIETAEANETIDDLLQVDGLDEIHIGLNDMHLAYRKRFMFELLIDGTVDRLCEKISKKGLPYGFGGIARLGYGMIPAEKIITEHYRLGSTRAILSRSFCNAEDIKNMDELKALFRFETSRIRDFERTVATLNQEKLRENHEEVARLVAKIVNG
ncbi:MAG: aldolase [Clostridia bacterium]|nr:aldolase [Clostridia bacterium]